MAAFQPNTCHLLRIPRELRDEIYAHCLASDEGYHYHAETNTLRNINGTAIDLGLLRTCKQVAAEAAEFTLSKNGIRFKTRIALVPGVEGVFGLSLLSTEYYLNSLLRLLDLAMFDAFGVVIDEFGTAELAEHISKQYPHSGIGAVIRSALRTKGQHDDEPDDAVVTLSQLTHSDRQALQETLQYICSHHGLPEWLGSRNIVRWLTYPKRWIGLGRSRVRNGEEPVGRNALEVASSTISTVAWQPWVTPTAIRIKKILELLEFLTIHGGPQYWCPVNADGGRELKYYESSASQGIRFLDTLPQRQRHRLRHLVIREDRKCSASRCHAYGLVPYLTDLPRLRIDHYVDMWSVIFLHTSVMLDSVNTHPASIGKPTCSLFRATFKTIQWINEAMNLRHAGMPLSAYSLHLEANTNTAQRIWNAIRALAALSLAWLHTTFGIEYSSPISIATVPKDELDFDTRINNRLIISVQLILSGSTTVRLSCPTGTLEEFEEEARCIGDKLKNKPRDAWFTYAESLVQGDLDPSDYDFTALDELYADPWWQ